MSAWKKAGIYLLGWMLGVAFGASYEHARHPPMLGGVPAVACAGDCGDAVADDTPVETPAVRPNEERTIADGGSGTSRPVAIDLVRDGTGLPALGVRQAPAPGYTGDAAVIPISPDGYVWARCVSNVEPARK